MRLGLILLWLTAVPALAQDCPPAPDRSVERAALMSLLASAPDAETARALSIQLWRIWTEAPDPRAQDLLDNGMARREAYDFARAEAFFDELVAYCPDYAEGWNQRAFARYLRGDYGNALEDLERALELAPDHVAAKAGQALTLMNLGRIEAGQAVLRSALKMNPWLSERALLLPEPELPGTEL